MTGVCIYCGKWTTDRPRPCIIQTNGKDYGHDYNHDEEYVAEATARRLLYMDDA